jgi:excisionase family DNA binding protein
MTGHLIALAPSDDQIEAIVQRLAALRSVDAIAEQLGIDKADLLDRLHDYAQPQLAYTVAQAARRVGLSYKAMLLVVHRGELPVLKPGQSFLVPADALEAWVKAKTYPNYSAYINANPA